MRNLVTCKSVGRYGRFCNAAYSIAGCLGVARKNGFDFALTEPWRNHDGRNFESDIDIDVFKQFVNPLPLYDGPELPQIGIPWGYHDVKLTHSCDLQGHFQSEKYFAHAIDEIRWYMRMVDEGPLTDYVGIHVRLGDYGDQPSPQHPDGNPYHPRMEMSYYGPAMAEFHGAKFLVFSDDIPEARKMLGDKVEYSESRTYLEDFKLLKKCSHFIVANSSFSAFAAVLGDAKDKKVVAPTPWFGAAYLENLDDKDIYGEDWIKINYQKQARAAA